MLGIDENKITVTYPAVDLGPELKAGEEEKEEEYILYVGNIKPHKNLKTLLEAFEIAKKKAGDMHLTVVGKDFMPKLTGPYRGNKQIRFINEVSHSTLWKIYRKAKMLVMPSLYEGFGLPPVEAMACGVPVACSNTGSLPEVVGDAAMLFEPMDSTALADILVNLWQDSGKRKKLIARGYERVKDFSWERCAEETARVYKEIA